MCALRRAVVAATLLDSFAAGEDVTRRTFRCATYDRQPEQCARAWVWRAGPCAYRRGFCRVRGNVTGRAALHNTTGTSVVRISDRPSGSVRSPCPNSLRAPANVSLPIITRPQTDLTWGPSNFTRMDQWPLGEDGQWWARVIHASQHPKVCGRYLLVTDDLSGAGLGMTARLLEVLLLTAVQRRRVLLEVPRNSPGRWCDRPPYTLTCFFRPWTHCPGPANGSLVYTDASWARLLQDKRTRAAANPNAPHDSIRISLSYVKRTCADASAREPAAPQSQPARRPRSHCD